MKSEVLYLPRPGDRVGLYVVEEKLASQGAMSRVYRVRHSILGSQHALKVLLPSYVEDENTRMRFLAEARIQAQHRHPHIVPVTDVVSEPGIAAIVLDWQEGEDLEDHLHRVRKVDLEQAIAWTRQVLSALRVVHDSGIVHRDLKPGNILLVDGTVRLVDFGIARIEGVRRTTVGIGIGTFGYMSPEQIEDASSVDLRADIFAVGTILYEMLAGRPAFSGSIGTIIAQVMSGRYVPLREQALDIPASLSEIIDTALQTDRDQRFATAADFDRALQGSIPRVPSAEQEQLSEVRSLLAAAQLALDTAQREREATMEEVARLWAALESAQGAREAAQAEATALRAQLKAAQAEATALQAQLEQAVQERDAASAAKKTAEKARRVRPEVVRRRSDERAAPLMPRRKFVPSARPKRPFTVSPLPAQALPGQSFALASAPVTRALWRSVTGSDPAHFSKGEERCPVEQVSWQDAISFCNRLSERDGLTPAYAVQDKGVVWDRTADGYRLPSAEEWALAAAASRPWPFAGGTDISAVAWYNGNADRKPHPVGLKKPNFWGLYDMSGNVWEWCWDVYIPPGKRTPYVRRVIRGGSWKVGHKACRLEHIVGLAEGVCDGSVGVRLARSLPQTASGEP